MTDQLTAVLSGIREPGLYRWSGRSSVVAVSGSAERLGWRFFYLDGRRVASKDDFLAACADAMSFPGYFGYNWDALEDSLRDLAWAPAQHGYLLLYDSAGRFARARPAEFATALDILRSAVESWQDTPTPMVVVVRGAGRAASRLPAL